MACDSSTRVEERATASNDAVQVLDDGGALTLDGEPWDVAGFEAARTTSALDAALATAPAVAIPPDPALWAYALTGAVAEDSSGDSF